MSETICLPFCAWLLSLKDLAPSLSKMAALSSSDGGISVRSGYLYHVVFTPSSSDRHLDSLYLSARVTGLQGTSHLEKSERELLAGLYGYYFQVLKESGYFSPHEKH